MPFSLSALTSEINTDPRQYGYVANVSTGNDQAIADKLNTIRDGTNPPANPTGAGGLANGSIKVRASNLKASDILEAIDTRDFVASPTAAQLSYFESISNLTVLNLQDDAGVNTRILRNLRDIIQNPGLQGSRARLDALASRFGTRSEELFGPDYMVTPANVAAALGRG